MCASGPGSLTGEAANAVARMQMSGRGMRLGGIALHTKSVQASGFEDRWFCSPRGMSTWRYL